MRFTPLRRRTRAHGAATLMVWVRAVTRASLCVVCAFAVLTPVLVHVQARSPAEAPANSAAAITQSERPATPLVRFSDQDRVVVIAPHPDDETLCCAGIMQRAASSGARVHVVWVTSGDGSSIDAWLEGPWPVGAKTYLTLGATRMAEARAAATAIGVSRDRQFFLGFPDASLEQLLQHRPDTPFRTPRTQVSSVPYSDAWRPAAPYTARELKRTLQNLLNATQPTWVLAPCTADTHPDHAALGRLVRELLKSRPQTTLACWIVHAKGSWPQPRQLAPDLPLLAPQALPSLTWQSVQLTAAERDTKLTALKHYRTQRRTMERFLLSFVRTNEIVASETPNTATGALSAVAGQ